MFWKNIFEIVKVWKSNNRSFHYILIVTALLALVFLKWACDSIEHYDTYLYHAQAIRWIEEYGVVPGLGNLHHRFAYNNSVFSLQALFSLSFLLGGKIPAWHKRFYLSGIYGICNMFPKSSTHA